MGRTGQRSERVSVVIGTVVALLVIGGVLVPAFSDDDPTAPETIATPQGPPAVGSAPYEGSLGGDAAPENVLGTDDRVRVTPTTDFPSRAVGHLVVRIQGTKYECSGSMIGPHTVLTAAHCIYQDGHLAGRGTFTLAQDAGQRPYGVCPVTGFYILGAYPDGEADADDMGAVRLGRNADIDCRQIGQQTGWFGYVGGVDWTNDTIYLRGYPGDKPDGEMWVSEGKITKTAAQYVREDADSTQGTSGAGIYCLYDPPGSLPYGHYISAVLVSGNFLRNIGSRITRARTGTIAGWKSQ